MPQTVLAGAAAPVWKSGGFSRNREQHRYRVNLALRDASDCSLYPFRMEILVRMSDPGLGGLATAGEQERLGAIEDRLLTLVGTRAVFAGALTEPGQQRYWWYTENAELAAELDGPLRDTLRGVSYDVESVRDQDWSAYRSLLREERQQVWAVLGLCVMLLLYGAWVLLIDGPTWAVGEIVVFAFVIAVIVRLRGRARWYLDHQRLAFGFFALLLGTVVFPVVSTVLAGVFSIRLAWAALAVSLIASAALVGAMWKLQLQQWREQVPGSPGPVTGAAPR